MIKMVCRDLADGGRDIFKYTNTIVVNRTKIQTGYLLVHGYNVATTQTRLVSQCIPNIV
jgi:hypothetical protein